jgi:hypothetical protein
LIGAVRSEPLKGQSLRILHGRKRPEAAFQGEQMLLSSAPQSARPAMSAAFPAASFSIRVSDGQPFEDQITSALNGNADRVRRTGAMRISLHPARPRSIAQYSHFP